MHLDHPRQSDTQYVPSLNSGLEGALMDASAQTFPFALFQIEPYIKPSILKMDRSSREYKASREEVSELYGQPLKYGMEVMLRHMYSGQLLYTDLLTAGEDINTWRVSVGKADSNACTLLKATPIKFTAEEGQDVPYDGALHFVFFISRTSLFLNISQESNALVASSLPRAFFLSKYLPYNSAGKTLRQLSPVTFVHTKLGECVSYNQSSELLELRKEETLDSYWICESSKLEDSDIVYHQQVKIRHAFLPLYLTRNCTLVSQTEDTFFFSWNTATGPVDDTAKVFIQTSPNSRIGVRPARIHEFLLSKLLPFSSGLESSETKAIAEVEFAAQPSLLMFELSPMSESQRVIYMEVQMTIMGYQKLSSRLISDQPPTNSELSQEFPRAKTIEEVYVHPNLHDQKYTDMLVKFKYHEALFHIIYTYAKPANLLEDLKPTFKELVDLWVFSLRVMVKRQPEVAEFISSKAEYVKELVQWNYLSAGQLYCTMIKVSRVLAGDSEEFCRQWTAEIEPVNEENAEKQMLYLKVLTSACNSPSKQAPEYRRHVLSFLKERVLVEFAKPSIDSPELSINLRASVQQSATVHFPLRTLSGLLSKYVSHCLFLYSSVCRDIDPRSSILISGAKMSSETLQIISKDKSNDPDIRKACGLLRNLLLLTPSQQFLSRRDNNFLYDLNVPEEPALVKDLPWEITESQQIHQISEEIWTTLLDTREEKCEEMEVKTLLEKVASLHTVMSHAFALINECQATALFLRGLKIAVSSILWAFGSTIVLSTESPPMKLSVFNLLKTACKRDSEGRLQTQLTQVFQTALQIYSLISKISIHRKVDEIVRLVVEKPGILRSDKDKEYRPDLDLVNECAKEIGTVFEKDEYQEWLQNRGEGEEERRLGVIDQFQFALDFEANNPPDSIVIWTMVNSPYMETLTPELKTEVEALLIEILYPKRTVQQCIEKSVIVKAFKLIKDKLVKIEQELRSPLTFQEFASGALDSFKKAIIKVCNILLARSDSKEFKKVQAIIRNIGLHRALAPYIIRLGQRLEPENRDIRTLCATFMCRFVFQNKLNRTALMNVLTEPVQFWEAPQFMIFIQETIELSEMQLGIIHNLMSKVLSDLLSDSTGREFSPSILTGLLFDHKGDPYPERQNILSRLLFNIKNWQTDATKSVLVYQLLAKCCDNNPSVISQCRSLFSVESMAQMVRREFDPVMLKGYIAFYQSAHMQQLPDSKPTTDEKSAVDILSVAWDRAFSLTMDKTQFKRICEDGLYSPVRPYSNPYLGELAFATKSTDPYLGAWSLISSGKNSNTESGLLLLISTTARVFKSKECLLHLFRTRLIYDLQELYTYVQAFHEEIDVSVVLSRLRSTAKIVIAVLGNPESPHLLPLEEPNQHGLGLLRVASTLKKDNDEVKKDEGYDALIASFSEAVKTTYGTHTELSKSIPKLWQSTWTGTSKQIRGLLAGFKNLLYKRKRDLYFNILKTAFESEDKTKMKMQLDLFKAMLSHRYIDDVIDSILQGRTEKIQIAALEFLSALVTDVPVSDLSLLKSHLTESHMVYELFLFFYNSISNLSAIIRGQSFQARLSDPSKDFFQFFKTHLSLGGNIFKFITITCDNLNKEWQDFFINQETENSIDITTEVAEFVASLGRYSKLCVTNLDLRNCLLEGLNALIELTAGGNANQLIVLQKVSLYPAINSLFESIFQQIEKLDFAHIETDQNAEDVIKVFGALSQLLLSLVENDEGSESWEPLIEYLRVEMIADKLFWLYDKVIQTDFEKLKLGLAPKPTKNLVASAIGVWIVLVKLSNRSPQPYSLMKVTNPNLLPQEKRYAYDFYVQYTGSIEISQADGHIIDLYFPMPFMVSYLTAETFIQMMLQKADLPHQDKLESFLKQVPECKDEMEHQQSLFGSAMLKFITGNWQLYGVISILVLLLINGLMILTFEGNEILGVVSQERNWVSDWMGFLGFLQLLMGVSSYVCHFIEYLPTNIYTYNTEQSFSFQEFCRKEDNASLLQYEELKRKVHEAKTEKKESLSVLQLVLICMRPKSFYFFFYFGLSLLGLIWYIFYSFLLLDAIRRFESLRRLLLAITNTWQQLLVTLIFETIIVYIFSMIGFMLFATYYQDDDGVLVCDSLFDCFISTLKTGLTQGGIGTQLKHPVLAQYWDRMAFDLLFWAMAIVIMLNITFGIIIDSYSGLREEYRQTVDQLENECFICGEDRDNLESHGEPWETHKLQTHFSKKYLGFLIYLDDKPDRDCSGTEKYVKNKFQRYDTTFFPTTSKHLQDLQK